MSRATIKPYRPVIIYVSSLVLLLYRSGSGRAGQHTQYFGENENQNHSDEESRLLSGTAHTGITDDTNGESRRKTRKTDGQTRTQLNEVGEESSVLTEVVGDEHGDDEAVNGNDTSHDDWDDV